MCANPSGSDNYDQTEWNPAKTVHVEAVKVDRNSDLQVICPECGTPIQDGENVTRDESNTPYHGECLNEEDEREAYTDERG